MMIEIKPDFYVAASEITAVYVDATGNAAVRLSYGKEYPLEVPKRWLASDVVRDLVKKINDAH